MSTQEAPPPKAQVAFMVTAKMKTQLGELQYTADDIKQLTPVEASLLIAHDVPALERARDLPLLVADYERQQEEDRKEREAAAAESAVAETNSAESTPSPSMSETRVEESDSHQSVPPHQPSDSPTNPPTPSLAQSLFGWMASENILDKPFEEAARSHLPSSSNRDWYEVVEEYADGTYDVVALHPNEEEASVDADLRKEIIIKRASREQKDVPQIQFVIRKITR
jgi:predicted fused transcriptional regulator/phosphomethylpyrimidine kinase